MKTKKLVVSAALTMALLGGSSVFAGESLKNDSVAGNATSVVSSNKLDAAESKIENASVFEAFEGSEQMASLSEQDKALTGAAWLTYRSVFWNSKMGYLGAFDVTSTTNTMWIKDCKTTTLLGYTLVGKLYVSCR